MKDNLFNKMNPIRSVTNFVSLLYKIKVLIIVWILVVSLSECSSNIKSMSHEYVDAYGIFLGIVFLCAYIYTYKFILENFSDTHENQWLSLVLYSLLTILLALGYSIPVAELHAVKEGTKTKIDMEMFEASYYSLMTLTTVGYGEFHPSGKAGQALSASMSIVGTLNMITLISTLVGNLKKTSE